jgi:hypothetical protein
MLVYSAMATTLDMNVSGFRPQAADLDGYGALGDECDRSAWTYLCANEIASLGGSKLEQTALRPSKSAFEVNRLKPISPIFQRSAIRLRCFLVRAQPFETVGMKLEPTFPGSVRPLLAADLNSICNLSTSDTQWEFADEHDNLVKVRWGRHAERLAMVTLVWPKHDLGYTDSNDLNFSFVPVLISAY